jgi:hypothetical protein
MKRLLTIFLSIIFGFIFYLLVYASFYYDIIRIPFLPDGLSGSNLWPIFSVIITLIFRNIFIRASKYVLNRLIIKSQNKNQLVGLKSDDNNKVNIDLITSESLQKKEDIQLLDDTKPVKNKNKSTLKHLFLKNQKIIAREFLVLILWVFLSFIWDTVNEGHRKNMYQEKNDLHNAINKSFITYSKEIFDYLEGKGDYRTSEHTLNSFRNKFDTSNSFRREIYERVAFYDPKYKNKNDFDEFVSKMQTKKIVYKGKEIDQKQASELIDPLYIEKPEQFPLNYYESEIYGLIFVILFIVRYLFYIIQWSFKILLR